MANSQAVGSRTPIGFGRPLFTNTAQHPTARFFALDFCADNESLLTQAEEDKEKDKQKDCCEAVGVRLPTAYRRVSL